MEYMPVTESSLIAEFNAEHSEEAFVALLRQHVNLVYATALRQVGDPGAAEEITQNVFVALAQSAGKLGSHPTIAGWLHSTTLNKSREWLRKEMRRRRREAIAVNLQAVRAEGESVWASLLPLLDEALLKMRETDRHAVILHYMEGRNFQEVGSVLGVSEDAARKRVNRCLDELTAFFRRHGFAVPALVPATPLFALSSHAAPAGLAAKAAGAGLAAAHSAASASTLNLIKGALKIMAWTKTQTAIVVGVAAILAIGTSAVIKKRTAFPKSWADDPSYWRLNNPPLASYPAVLILRPTRFSGHGGGIGDGSRWMKKDAPIEDLVAIAYGFPDTRVMLPEDIQRGRAGPGYDLMLTLRYRPLKALQDEIAKQFGLVGHAETIVTNAFLVKVANPGAPGLKRPTSASGQHPGWFGDNWSLTIHNHLLDYFLSGFIESEVEQPVFDETGLSGRYDLHMQWKPEAGETDKAAFERALREQLGLELVPTEMPVKILVVEKTK